MDTGSRNTTNIHRVFNSQINVNKSYLRGILLTEHPTSYLYFLGGSVYSKKTKRTRGMFHAIALACLPVETDLISQVLIKST